MRFEDSTPTRDLQDGAPQRVEDDNNQCAVVFHDVGVVIILNRLPHPFYQHPLSWGSTNTVRRRHTTTRGTWVSSTNTMTNS
jgi:hypothetical protein